MKEKKRLIINLLATAVAALVQFGVNFILTPYIVQSLGAEAYSFIPLTNNIVGYANIITVAFYSMTARFVSIEYNKGNKKEANIFFNSALMSDIILAAILIIPSVIITLYSNELINVPEKLIVDVKLTFAFSFVNMLLSLCMSAFGSVYYITNRLDLNAKRNIECNIVRAVLLVFLYGVLPAKIYYLIITIFLVNILLTGTNVFYCRKLTPELKPNFRVFRLSAVKMMISSGVWNAFNQASNVMLTTLDLLLANLFAGAAMTGVYSISKTVPNFILSVVGMLVPVFVPQLTIYYAQNKRLELQSALSYSVRCMGLICSFPIGFLMVFGKEFFHLWVPTQNASMLYWLSVITLFSLMISCSTEVVYNVFTVTNKLKVPAIVLFVLGVLNTIFVIVLMNATSLGIWSVPFAALLTSLFRNLVFTPVYASRVCLKIPCKDAYIPIVRGVLCTLVMVLVCLGYYELIHITYSWITLIIAGISCCLVAGILNIFVVFNYEERKKLFMMFIHRR